MSLLAKRKAEAADSKDNNTAKLLRRDPAVDTSGGDIVTASDASDDGDFKVTEEKCSRKKPKAKEIGQMNQSTVNEGVAARLNELSGVASLSDYEKCSIFPQKLMQLLKNEEDSSAIWWLEDGESFAIEQEQFTKVMNKVSRTSKKKVKLDSILRNLYRWGFKKLKDRDLPPNVLAYSHPKFKRNGCAELETFSKPEVSTTGRGSPGASTSTSALPGAMPAPTALARALSARAKAGYGDNWNEEGAADKASIMQNNQMALFDASRLPRHPLPRPEEERMMMQSMMMQQHHQQQQHRHMLLQQELFYHEQQQQQHRHHQALLMEAATAERAAMEHYATHRLGGSPSSGCHYPHHMPGYPF